MLQTVLIANRPGAEWSSRNREGRLAAACVGRSLFVL